MYLGVLFDPVKDGCDAEHAREGSAGQYITEYRWRIRRRSKDHWLKGGEGGDFGFSGRLPREPGVAPVDVDPVSP